MRKIKQWLQIMALCALVLCSSIVPAYAQNTEGALTPDGNMTLVDDIVSTSEEDKQFITVTSKNGNVFYIIIDRADEGENTVHFLNQVDESDLLSLMGEEPVEEVVPVCICKTACEAGNVNINCPVCTLNYEDCTGEEPEETVAAPVVEEKSNSMVIPTVIAVIVLLGAGGGYLYYKKLNKEEVPTTEDNETDEDDELPTEEDDGQDNIVG